MTRPAVPPRRTPPQRNPLRTVVLFVGALLFLAEEWLWTRLTRFFAWLSRFGVMRWLDARLARVPPAMALVVLCVPMALLFPFKIAGLWMIASGRIFTGCLLMLVAKIASTAVIARIFLTCRPQLLRMPWFARLHAWTCALRERIHAWIAEQPAWHEARRFARLARAHVRAWMHGTTYDATTARDAMRPGALQRWRKRRKARRARPVDAPLAAAADVRPKGR